MPTGLADVLHDAAVLHRLVGFIGEYCKEQERSQTYVGSARLFFEYVEQLVSGTQDNLGLEVERASRFPKRLPTPRRNIRTLKLYLRSLHTLIKPAADAHTLTVPGPLVDLAYQQLQSIDGMRGSNLLVLLTPEFMYFQRPHTEVKDQARIIQSFIPKAAFPQKLGFIELPYSQGPSFFTNLAIYHEIGHFVYEELANRNPPHSGFEALTRVIGRSLNRVFGLRSSNGRKVEKNRQAFAIGHRILEDWTQEIFCDLFALRLLGPAFSFALIEMMGMLGFLSQAQCETFNPTHPAPSCRFAEHVRMLREDSWWDAISDVQAEQKKLLEKMATISRYKFFLDERRAGPEKLRDEFVNSVVPVIRKLARQVTARAIPSVGRFQKVRSSIEGCLGAGVVPLTDTPDKCDPVAIINSAFCFYLTSVPKVIEKFEKTEHHNSVATYSRWTKRIEMWSLKALEDAQIMTRFKRYGKNGPVSK